MQTRTGKRVQNFTVHALFSFQGTVKDKGIGEGDLVDIDTRAGEEPVIDKVGVDGGEGTPVPIPNTAVKLTCADNTWLVAAREDR